MTVTVHGPGGVTVHFPDGTDNATIDQVMRHATGIEPAAAAPSEQPKISQGGAALRAFTNPLGISDEIGGALTGVLNVAGGALGLNSPGNDGSFSAGYNDFTSRARALDQAGQEQWPKTSLAGTIGGVLATSPWLAPEALAAGGAVRAGTAGLGTLVKAGIKTGAKYGAIAGAGNAEGGIGNRIVGGVEGAATGAVTGGALPVAGRLLKLAAKPAIDAVAARLNPAGYAAQKVTDRLANAGLTVDTAADRLDRAAVNGDSMALADVGGDSLRKLGRTVVNTPGPGQIKLMAAANRGAMAQGGRLKGKVADAFLADPAFTYPEAKAAVMDARSSGAKPYYDLAYRTPVPYTFDLQEMLQTPAGKAGLAAAKRNSANRREPWAQWFANVADDGTITDLKRVPDTRALDEVKRVLDTMVEAAKRPADGSPFGKALHTPDSLAVQSVRDDLRNFLTTHNKPYEQALAKGLDNIQADEALEFGRNALTADPRVIAKRMGTGGAGRDKAFNEGQQELARIGLVEAARAKIDALGMTHNGLLKLFSTPDQVARLRPFFRDSASWGRFRTSMFNEARKRKTYEAFKGNSTTAGQLADMQEAGALAEGVQTVAHAAHSGVVTAAASAIIRSLRRLGGLTPQVADRIAQMIATRDPAQVRAILRQIHNIELSKASKAQKLNAVRNLLTVVAASREGHAMAPRPNEPVVAIR